MFSVFRPRFFVWLAAAVHASPYVLIVSAIYWSNYWLLLPAVPIIYLQASTLIPLRRGPFG